MSIRAPMHHSETGSCFGRSQDQKVLHDETNNRITFTSEQVVSVALNATFVFIKYLLRSCP